MKPHSWLNKLWSSVYQNWCLNTSSNIIIICDHIIINVLESLNNFSLFIPMLKITPSRGHIICSALPFQESVALFVKIVELSLLKGVLCKGLIQSFDRKVKATDNTTYKYLTNFDKKKAPLSLQVQMCKFKLWLYSNDH